MTNFGPGPTGANAVYNLTAATVIKAGPGTLYAVSVVVAGSAAGAVYDSTSTSGNSAANQLGAIPTATGNAPYIYNWNCQHGIVVVPPTGGTVAVSFV